ncbi:MAG: response regulator [Frankiales bacterium]|nr:response regulator [Frankiales bacterium]
MTASGSEDRIRVFLVDPCEVVRRGLTCLLDAEPDLVVCGEASRAADALRLVPAARPDVVILDIRLPDVSGVELCREMQARHPQVALVVLTGEDDQDSVVDAIEAGAAGFLLKQVRGATIVDAVRRGAAGESTLDPAVTRRVLDQVRHASSTTEVDQLTAQEQRILHLIGEGMTNREIADSLFLAEKTVKNYVSSIFAKLGLHRRTQAAVFAVRHPD